MESGGDAKNPFNNDYTSIITADAVYMAIAIVCVGLRLHVRKNLAGAIGLDDWLLIAGVIIYCISVSCDIGAYIVRARVGVTHGDPGHLLEVIDIFTFLIAECLVRGAYTAFYLGIVPYELGLAVERRILLGVYAIYTACQTTIAFVYLFQCGVPTHLTHFFGSHCVSPTVLSIMFKSVLYWDVAFDCLMVLIPIRVVLQSTMPRRTKRVALCILSLGFCAGLIALAIIPISDRQHNYNQQSGANMRLGIVIDILVNCELMVAIVCLSLFTYRPLLTRWLGEASPATPQMASSWLMTSSPVVTRDNSMAISVNRQISVATSSKFELKQITVSTAEVPSHIV